VKRFKNNGFHHQGNSVNVGWIYFRTMCKIAMKSTINKL